jgi:hypothetical protein
MTQRRLVLALLAMLASTAPRLLAQSERLTIRLSPTPNQTTKLRSAQDTVMTTEGDAATDGAPPFPMAMTMHMEMEVTSAVGPTDDRGQYSSQMTMDHIATTMTMNGQSMPSPVSTADIEKHVVTFSYDDQGKILDVSVDGGDSIPMNDVLKQMMRRAFATVAPMTLSVGESVTIPTALDLPLPGAAGSTGAMGIGGETRYTLTSVTFDGADRIAHLAIHSTSTVTHNQGAGSSRPPMALEMTATGDGTTDVNVDRGLILHAELHSTMNTSMQPPVRRSGASRIRMHGTFSVVSDLVK